MIETQPMNETQTVPDSRMRPPRAHVAAADHRELGDHQNHRDHPDQPRRPRLPGRAVARVRGLLRAQALLDGTAGGPYDVTFVEDDRRRLSGRRAR